jgi:hypothetical protein
VRCLGRFAPTVRTAQPHGAPDRGQRGILIGENRLADADDPIYGAALAITWKWLESVATATKSDTGHEDQSVDLGIAAMDRLLSGVEIAPFLTPRSDAPVMFSSYLDTWAHTSPTLAPGPDVAIFLHGRQRNKSEVQI